MAEMCPFPSPTRLKGCRKFKNNRQEPSRQLCRRDGRPGRTWGIAHRGSSKSKAPGDKCAWGMTATARRRAAFLGKWQDGALRAQSTAARVRRHGTVSLREATFPSLPKPTPAKSASKPVVGREPFRAVTRSRDRERRRTLAHLGEMKGEEEGSGGSDLETDEKKVQIGETVL